MFFFLLLAFGSWFSGLIRGSLLLSLYLCFFLFVVLVCSCPFFRSCLWGVLALVVGLRPVFVLIVCVVDVCWLLFIVVVVALVLLLLLLVPGVVLVVFVVVVVSGVGGAATAAVVVFCFCSLQLRGCCCGLVVMLCL